MTSPSALFQYCSLERNAHLRSLKLKDLLRSLTAIRDQWQNLGVMLGCTTVTLNSIKLEESDTLSCLRKMLEERLKQIDPPLSWDIVMEAVECVDESQAERLKLYIKTRVN